MDDELRTRLRAAYGPRVADRERFPMPDWKARERQQFLEQLQREGLRTLLELGAGAGNDGAFFRDHGIDVLCTDLTPEMVASCQGKGLRARVMDLSQLDVPAASFDAAYAVNCLLHVPNRDLRDTLQAIHAGLKPGGLFYAGVYGGRDQEGVWEDDELSPKRFFALRTDARILEMVAQVFAVHSFKRVQTGDKNGLHFQSLFLRKQA